MEGLEAEEEGRRIPDPCCLIRSNFVPLHCIPDVPLESREILSKTRGNKSETKSLSEEAIHASLVGSFYVLGRKTVMNLMSEAEALGSQAVVNANQYK